MSTPIVRHAFLTPGHNCWSFWTADGSKNLINELSATHRVLETLVYAIDTLSTDGWRVQQIYAEQGTPSLVLLVREEHV